MSETAKHTAGPWSEHGKGGCECGQIFGPDGNLVIAVVYGPKHLDLDDGPDCVPNRDRQIANARLIAAAPELLAALKGLAEQIDRAMEGADLYPDDLAEARETARAAVAEAEGQAP